VINLLTDEAIDEWADMLMSMTELAPGGVKLDAVQKMAVKGSIVAAVKMKREEYEAAMLKFHAWLHKHNLTGDVIG